MAPLQDLTTPCALVDTARLDRNIERMQSRLAALGVRFRPHVKTSKCVEVVRRQAQAGAAGLTVSTLKEAQQFFDAGYRDILYAVGIAPNKFTVALQLRERGCDLKLLTDNVAAAQALGRFAREHDHRFEVWIEVDTDGHRSGIGPESPLLLDVAREIVQGGNELGGVMTHAGASYALDDPEALRAIAEQERAGCVRAAQRLRAAGFTCPNVSVGSTPTALSAASLDGVTEVRAGVYVFFDLVMANVGVCAPQDIALSVLTTVIGHQPEKGWAIVDAGWMAMSRDTGTSRQKHDYGYGQVCAADGTPLEGWVMSGANQEHGIVSGANGEGADIERRFPVGMQLRILPNHACATAAQFPEYVAVEGGHVAGHWPRFSGW